MAMSTNGKLSRRLRLAVMAFITSGVAAIPTAHATNSNKIILVPPADLPELARQSGEAMLYHETNDGRSILYIEQNRGARLAIFDVTDPVHIKGEGSVQLDAAGPFDFLFPLGRQAELVRYRQDRSDAVLDLHRVPALKTAQGLKAQGPAAPLGDDGFVVDGDRDVQVVETEGANDLGRVFDVTEVRQQITKADTGTTFLLAKGGLYVIRRPNAEMIHQLLTISPN
jgi:hypothetical protein